MNDMIKCADCRFRSTCIHTGVGDCYGFQPTVIPFPEEPKMTYAEFLQLVPDKLTKQQNHEVVEAIKRYRGLHHISQREVARAIGFTVSWISQIEAEKVMVPQLYLKWFCRFLDFKEVFADG